MNIYVPIGLTELAVSENDKIAFELEELEATTTRFFGDTDDERASITSMISCGTDVNESINGQAEYVSRRLGRDVLFLCTSQTQRDELITRLGRQQYSIMAATNALIFTSALKVHLGSQKLKENLEKGHTNS
jgi:hypothetical protein